MRRIVTAALVIGAAAGLAAGGWWLSTHRAPADGNAQPSAATPGGKPLVEQDRLSGTDKAKSFTGMVQLVADAKDVDKPWTTVLTEAKALLSQPGIDQQAVTEILKHAESEVAQLTKDFDAVEFARSHDVGTALALASSFRTGHQRAGDFLARLPLPGRLKVASGPPRITATLNGSPLDATSAAGPDGVMFCRTATLPCTISVSAPGFMTETRELPANPSIATSECSVTLVEAPLWTMEAPGGEPAWSALEHGPGQQVINAQPASIQQIDATTGHLIAALKAGEPISGGGPGLYTWTALADATQDGHLVVSNSKGALYGVAVAADGLHPSLIALCEHAVVHLDRGVLVFRLNAPALFTTSVTRPGKPPPFGTPVAEQAKILLDSDLTAISEGKTLWTLTLAGNQPAFVRTRGEQLVVIDDRLMRIVDPEGKELRTQKLPADRTGPVVDSVQGCIIAVPCGHNVTFWRDSGGTAYQVLQVATPVHHVASGRQLAGAAGADLLLTSAGSTVTLYQASATGLSERWTITEPTGGEIERVFLVDGIPCYLDSHHWLHLRDVADHHDIRRLRIPDGVTTAPIIVGSSLLVTDTHGDLKAYPLANPYAAETPAKP